VHKSGLSLQNENSECKMKVTVIRQYGNSHGSLFNTTSSVHHPLIHIQNFSHHWDRISLDYTPNGLRRASYSVQNNQILRRPCFQANISEYCRQPEPVLQVNGGRSWEVRQEQLELDIKEPHKAKVFKKR